MDFFIIIKLSLRALCDWFWGWNLCVCSNGLCTSWGRRSRKITTREKQETEEQEQDLLPSGVDGEGVTV